MFYLLYIENFDLGYIFWMVSSKTLISHLSFPHDKNFLQALKFFYHMIMNLVFDIRFESLILLQNSQMASTRALT
jgi:hypothetical protein